MANRKMRVGITHGDINGIGYEVIMKTLMDSRILESCTPIIYGSSKVASYHRKALNLTSFSFVTVKNISEVNNNKINIINCIDENARVELGSSTKIAGDASFQALEAAVKGLNHGDIDVIVTAPINKKNIQSDDFNFPGHTEYLAKCFQAENPLMLMVGSNLKVGFVTTHLPLSEVSSAITEDKICTAIESLCESLRMDFGVQHPRIAVLSINPHAGDDGVIGNEEIDVIIPAIKKCKKNGIMAFGPLPADGLFGSSNYLKYDAILAMYHDQGMIPFKALSSGDGVNYTAGITAVRTSPSHGTAFEIAGKGVADEGSFRKALFLALDIYKTKTFETDIRKSPLKRYKNVGRGEDVSASDL